MGSKMGGREKTAQVGRYRYPVLHCYLSIDARKRRFGASNLTIRVFQHPVPFEIFDALYFGGLDGVKTLQNRILTYDPEKETASSASPVSNLTDQLAALERGRFALSVGGGLPYRPGEVRNPQTPYVQSSGFNPLHTTAWHA
jgi:hypothetical protein